MMKNMRWIFYVVLLTCLGLQAQDGDSEPSMDDAADKDMEESGWVSEAPTLPDGPEVKPPSAPAPAGEEKLTAEEISKQRAAAAKIPESHYAAYFGARPESYLIDPQQLLDAKSTRERLAYLKGHAEDSKIDLYVYVFNKDQIIPDEVRKDEWIKRNFSGARPAAIVYYHLGAPQQSALYLSPSLGDVVPSAERRRVLQSCIIQASEIKPPQEQLEAFIVQMAIRIYWMEAMLGGDTTSDEQKRAQLKAAKLMKKGHKLSEKWERLRPIREDHAVFGVVLGGVIVALIGLIVWLRWRATYDFPELQVEHRLGGEHAAGVGAVIAFAKASPSPAAQRNQVPDYMRRG